MLFVLTETIEQDKYMICRYLIEEKGWIPEMAIETFNEARGHEITREQDLRSL